MTLLWVLSWQNLIFLAPFGLATVYLGLYVLTGLEAGDADADVDSDFDHDFDHDFDADADADVDHDVDADHDADTDTDMDNDDVPTLVALVSWLGVGRVPLSIVLTVLLMSFGVIGFVTNQIAADHLPRDWKIAMVSLPIALIGSAVITRTTSRLIQRYLPLNQNFARRRHELLGSVAEAIFPIDHSAGTAVGRDEHGDHFQVACRVESNGHAIPKGSRVQLIAYDAREKAFTVEECKSAARARG